MESIQVSIQVLIPSADSDSDSDTDSIDSDIDILDIMNQSVIIWKSIKNDESNTLKLRKTNDTDEFIFWQNSEVLSDIINKNVSISFRIQIHQNVNLNLIDQIVARYSVV